MTSKPPPADGGRTRVGPGHAHSRSADVALDAIEDLLAGGIGLTTRALAESAGAADLTLPQWRVLVIIAEADGLRVGELANRLGVAEPSVSRFVRRLERHGFVTTERDDVDRRATNVRLSDLGRQTRDIVLDRRREFVVDATRGALSDVSDEAIGLLRRIADALTTLA